MNKIVVLHGFLYGYRINMNTLIVCIQNIVLITLISKLYPMAVPSTDYCPTHYARQPS